LSLQYDLNFPLLFLVESINKFALFLLRLVNFFCCVKIHEWLSIIFLSSWVFPGLAEFPRIFYLKKKLNKFDGMSENNDEVIILKGKFLCGVSVKYVIKHLFYFIPDSFAHRFWASSVATKIVYNIYNSMILKNIHKTYKRRCFVSN
jgi:hypothetical protein